MDKDLKRKIRRLWRNRWLVSMAGLMALGLSVLQIQDLLRHRPTHMDWLVDLSANVETLTDEESSQEERRHALNDIRSIANSYDLVLTRSWAKTVYELDVVLEHELARVLARKLVQRLAWSLREEQVMEREHYLLLARELARELAPTLQRGQSQEQELVQAQFQDLEEMMAQAQTLTVYEMKMREHALIRELAQGQALALALSHLPNHELEQVLEQALALELELEQVLVLEQVLEQTLALELELEQVLEQPLDLELEQVLALEQVQVLQIEKLRGDSRRQILQWEMEKILAQSLAQTLEWEQLRASNLNIRLTQIMADELEHQHNASLLGGHELDGYQENELLRSRLYFKSGIFLGCSLTAFGIVLFTLIQLRSPIGVSRPTHLVAFLPEDYVAELGALNNRLVKQNISSYQRRLRLLEEAISLFRVFYIQMPLENLFLPSDDRSIDD